MKQSFKLLLTLVVIAVVYFLITSVRGDTTTHVNFGEDALTVTGPRQFSYTVNYDDIEQLELAELTNEGTIVSGDENRRYSWGVRENDTWGQYTLCVSKKIDVAVVVTTSGNERLVFNYESDDTTEAIREMFTELLASRDASQNAT